ncbi:MAG: hypothetical protein KGK30_02740, partial [Elusimicrobia bacterium]|nr:hypothetical protein [Elusimicrobiota bacterium]
MPLAALGFWLALSCSAAGPRLGIDAAPGMETPGLDPSPSLQLITPLLLPGSAIQVVTPPAEAAATSALENAGPLAALGLKPHPTPRDIARLQAALSPWSGAGLDLHPDPERLAALFTGEQAAAGKTGLIVPQAPAPEGFRNEGGLLLAQPRPDAVLEAASQDRAEVLAAIEGPDFLRQPQARQEAALERLSQLWELGSKPRPEPLLSLLAARPPLAVRERVYDLLDRLGPAYFSSQQEGLLLKAIDRNPGDELLPAGQAALGRAAGELAGLSESGYHHYLNILSRQPLAFHAEGLPGFSPQTSFGIELEFAAVDRELNKSDRSATEALEAHLMERIPRLIEKGELAPGWVIKHDGDGNPEINTPVLTNDRAGFEELGRGLSNIRSLLDSWFKDKPHALAQGMHIHVGTPSPSIERDAALAFLGKAMERLWASLSPTNDLGMVAFKPGALFGDAHTGKNKTFRYTDTRKGTVAFNAFAPVPFPSGDFIERLQAAVGVAM